MSLRTANIEVSLQRLSILRIEHPQANPLRLACTLRTGESLPSGLQLTAEIHTSRNVPAETTPLAATTVTVGASATTFEIDFTSAQTNQTVTPESTRPLWLVIYGVGDADALYTLATADLLLGWHAISRVTPPPPATAALVEKGGVAWVTARAYAAGTMVTVGTTAYVASSAHTSGSTTQPGTGASWATVWAVLSGGGGTTDLTMTRTPNAVTITPSGGGTAATIPQATDTAAGVLTAAHHAQIQALGTISTQAANNVAITGGTITGTTVSGITLTNGGSGALTVTGTASITGTTSGTNTGDQTIALTGDVTGSGTGSFAATIASNAVTAGKIASNAVTTSKLDAEAVTYAKIQSLAAASTLLGRGTTGGASVREIGIGAGLTMSGDTLSASGTGDVVGPASSTANAIARFSGTGGKTLLNSSIRIDDETISTQPNVTVAAVSVLSQANVSIVIQPLGSGAFILGPKPDGSAAGGGVRGANALDLQRLRAISSQIASGTRSVILSGNGNTASNVSSTVLNGDNNTASNYYASVLSGQSNTASGNASAVTGTSNTASNADSAVIGGASNTASAASSAVIGGSRAVANRIGMQAQANGQHLIDGTAGDAQRGSVVMRRRTTDATPVPLSMDGAAPTGASITTSTHFILLNNQTVFADIKVVARSTGGADHAAFIRRVLIKRDANAASTAIVGTVLSPTADIKSAGATLWDVSPAAIATATEGGLLINVTGAASTTINWSASVEFVETIRA